MPWIKGWQYDILINRIERLEAKTSGLIDGSGFLTLAKKWARYRVKELEGQATVRGNWQMKPVGWCWCSKIHSNDAHEPICKETNNEYYEVWRLSV